MPRASAAKEHAVPPSLETILKRVDEIKRGTVKLRFRKELDAAWTKARQKAR